MPWAHEAALRSGSDSTVQRLAAAGGKALGGGVSARADMGAVRYLMRPDGPRDSCKSVLSGGRCISVLRMPAFDTTPPGMGGRLKPRCARHGNFTPPRIAPSRPQAGVSLCTDEVMAKTACPLFLDGWVPLAALFGRLLWGIPTGGSWRTLQSRFAPFGRIVRERISVAGYDRAWSGVFQGSAGAWSSPLTTKPSSRGG